MTTMIDDDMWSAVGHPIRRRVMDLLLADGSHTATTLSQALPISRQAVAKHLDVLEDVDLVGATSAGRQRHYAIDQAQLGRAVAQLRDVGNAWDGRLNRIKQIAEEIEQNNEGDKDNG